MREYKVIDSATSVEQLRLRLKEGELEQYGEAFTPDFVYDVIKRLPRFVTMRVGSSIISCYYVLSLTDLSVATNKTPKNSLDSSSRVSMTNVFM